MAEEFRRCPRRRPTRKSAVDPTNSLTVYAGTQLALYKTTNGGATWVQSNSGLQAQSDLGSRLRVDNVPALRLAARLSHLLSRSIVGVYLHRKFILGVDELEEQRESRLGGIAAKNAFRIAGDQIA